MDIRRGSRINTDPFPKRAPKTQASRGAVQSMFPLEKFFWLNSLSPRSWISDSFRQDIGQTSTWKVLFLLKLFISKKSDQFLQSGGNLFGSALGHNDLTSMTSGKLHWENGFVCFETVSDYFRDHFSLSGQVKVGKFTSREVNWIWQIHVFVEQGRQKKKQTKQNKTNKQKQEWRTCKVVALLTEPIFCHFSRDAPVVSVCMVFYMYSSLRGG